MRHYIILFFNLLLLSATVSCGELEKTEMPEPPEPVKFGYLEIKTECLVTENDTTKVVVDNYAWDW